MTVYCGHTKGPRKLYVLNVLLEVKSSNLRRSKSEKNMLAFSRLMNEWVGQKKLLIIIEKF